MASWSKDELDRINAETYFTVGVTLPDGTTPKTVDIWSVPVGDRIFIRSFNGAESKWFGPALETRKGKISAGGGPGMSLSPWLITMTRRPIRP